MFYRRHLFTPTRLSQILMQCLPRVVPVETQLLMKANVIYGCE
jgi:hypothetical protein